MKDYEKIIKEQEAKLVGKKKLISLIHPDKKMFDSADYEKSRKILNVIKNKS